MEHFLTLRSFMILRSFKRSLLSEEPESAKATGWRDDPKDEEDLLIVRNDVSKGCVFQLVATNMFDDFAYYLEKDFPVTLLNHKGLGDIRKANGKSQRARNICTGIVVPVNKTTTVGYRLLMGSDTNIKKILSALDKPGESSKEEAKEIVMENLQAIITASVIALDKCDFGTNLELGIDLFCSAIRTYMKLVRIFSTLKQYFGLSLL